MRSHILESKGLDAYVKNYGIGFVSFAMASQSWTLIHFTVYLHCFVDSYLIHAFPYMFLSFVQARVSCALLKCHREVVSDDASHSIAHTDRAPQSGLSFPPWYFQSCSKHTAAATYFQLFKLR
jgi:hypothetical protein